mgnify:CR=1 FL=1
MIIWQRLEGALIALACIASYHHFDQSWLLFVLLILAPDLSALGYLFDSKRGAFFYNLAHNYVVPAAFVGVGFAMHWHYLITIALIWCAHIGIDRALGYGLKAPSSFKDTHLGRIGRE